MPSILVYSTTSLPMDLNSKEESGTSKNQNDAKDVSTIKMPYFTNNVLIIVFLTMAIMFIIALCAFCYSCFLRRRVLQRRKSQANDPNAPNQQQLQDAYNLARRDMLEPNIVPGKLDFSIFQSESSTFRDSLHRWASMKNLPRLHSSEQSALREKQPSHYATTPRSVFPAFTQKWGETSVKKIEKLRTKLVARFPSSSSHSASDISVFFSASSRNSEFENSQLSSDEENDCKREAAKRKSKSLSKSGSKSAQTQRVPSIVIEFVQ